MIDILKKTMRELEIYRNNHAVFRRRAIEWKTTFPEAAAECAKDAEFCYMMMQSLYRAQSSLMAAVTLKHRNEPGFNLEKELAK